MDVLVCSYRMVHDGYHHTQVAEVFLTLDAYLLWLHTQVRWPDIQYMDGKDAGTRLITNFSDEDYGALEAQWKKVIG